MILLDIISQLIMLCHIIIYIYLKVAVLYYLTEAIIVIIELQKTFLQTIIKMICYSQAQCRVEKHLDALNEYVLIPGLNA